jgi:hypothetical protein
LGKPPTVWQANRYDIVNEADLAAGVAKLATFHGQPAPRSTVLPRRTGTDAA